MTTHLIHIGHPKAGSHFLKRWFSDHPEIAYDPRGFAGFRDVFALAAQSAEPLPGIRCRVTSSEVLATPHVHAAKLGIAQKPGRGATNPQAQAEVCRLLACVFPNAYVLLLTRGFRSMLMSSYSQYVRTGGEADFPGQDDEGSGAFAWHYDHLVDIYTRAFGERLIVLPYELLRDDPDAFVRAIERPLGLGHCPPPRTRLNPSLSPTELRWYPRLTRFVGRLPIGARLREKLMRYWFRALIANRLWALVALLQAVRPAEPVTDRLVTEEMVEYFRGRAEFARGRAVYAPYADDYLL